MTTIETESRLLICELTHQERQEAADRAAQAGAVVETRAADSDEVKEAQQQELPGVGGRGRRKDKAEA